MTTVLRTQLVVDGDAIRAVFAGSAESESFEQLASFIDQIEVAAKRATATHVVADVRELEFATSSCLKALATWLSAIAERTDTQYEVEFLSSSRLSWQRRSLQAIAACAPAHVKVTAS